MNIIGLSSILVILLILLVTIAYFDRSVLTELQLFKNKPKALTLVGFILVFGMLLPSLSIFGSTSTGVAEVEGDKPGEVMIIIYERFDDTPFNGVMGTVGKVKHSEVHFRYEPDGGDSGDAY